MNAYLRMKLCLVLIALLLSQSPVTALASWGLEVGRADAGDVGSLAADWNAFKRARNRINDAMLKRLPIERQRQLLGLTEDDRSNLGEIAERAQAYWLKEVVGPLQRMAVNPAASCAEAQFSMATVLGLERQRQLIGLEDNPALAQLLETMEGMVSQRCREEAFDECMATGRFMQIPALMMGAERQAQLRGQTSDLESWALDALKQCAVYELHFVSTTKGGRAPMGIETVRDGRVPIKFEAPPGGLMQALRGQMSDVLKGQTAGGGNPFFVSVKCSPPTPVMEVVCSPGADSTPIMVGINELDLKHREFYVESELSKERQVGEDKFSFDFSGGMYSLQGLIKAPFSTVSMPFPDWGNSFYMAHQKDSVGGPRSGKLKIVRVGPGVYPVLFRFIYEDQGVFGGATVTDSTVFELIHKPKPTATPVPRRRPR